VPVDYANAKLTAGLGQLICPICARRDEDGIPMEESVKGEETLERVVDELSRRGYTEHFKAVEGGLQALGTGQRFEPKDLVIRGYYASRASPIRTTWRLRTPSRAGAGFAAS